MAIKTRQQAINEIIDNVENWDIDCLVETVRVTLGEFYQERTDAEVESDYNSEFNTLDDEEGYTKIVNTKASRVLMNGVKKCQP
jgi:hypothetical protein